MLSVKLEHTLPLVLALGGFIFACSSDSPGGTGPTGGSSAGGQDGGGTAGTMNAAGSSGTAAGGAAAGAGTAGTATAGTGGTAGGGGIGGSGGASGGGCVLSKTDDQQPMLLSETGCVNMTDPTKPAPGLIPYSVRSPLWSDAATKERFLRLPDGGKIHVLDCATEPDLCKDPGLGGNGEDEGHFDMPVGTVLVKNFSIEGKHIETRLFMRRSSISWKGFSYEWNEAQTDAMLLPDNPDGKDKMVGAAQQTWHYPSRSQCMECHTQYAGRSLGPSTAQLNSDFAYDEGSMNQLEKLKQLGVFEVPPKDIKGYPTPADEATGSLEERARSYLQANCAICHRPGGEFNSIDMRYATPFAMTNLCNGIERDQGIVPTAFRIVPGKPEMSATSYRMHTLEKVRMPKIGSNVVDPAGTKLIDDWISAMPASACPDQMP